MSSLVISRRVDESVRIGKTTVIKVVGIKGSVVRLHISAPKSVPILRTEIKPRHMPDRYVYDFEHAGQIAGQVQVALAHGDWQKARDIVAAAPSDLNAVPCSMSDMFGNRLGNALESMGIHTLDELAKRESRDVFLTSNLGVKSMDLLNSALVQHRGIIDWWVEP